jgi:flavorubredoxin
MSVELFNEGGHVCVAFNDLVDEAGVQSNQFLVIDGDESALIDPGGNLTFSRLYVHAGRYTRVKDLKYVIASHQDPDVVASVNKWLVGTSCKVVIARVWERFLPHFLAPGNYDDERIITIPDEGMNIVLGSHVIRALPAHFLHSVGNFHFYDTASKILFSGDMGASVGGDENPGEPVSDFEAHIANMLPFHQRYMVNNRVCRLWANMARELDLEWIVPQHGAPFRGQEVIVQFLEWVAELECGTDLMKQENFQPPPA